MDLIRQYLDQVDLESNSSFDEDESIVQNLIDDMLGKISKGIESEKNAKSISKKKRSNADEIIISSDESSSSSEELEEEELDLSGESDYDDLINDSTRLLPTKTKGELLIEELPPPEEESIQLTMNLNELVQIGHVIKIFYNLVIVESFKNIPALDLESFLFFKTGLSVGRVFDVIGPVSKPFYVIRFASNQNIIDKSIFINMPVYFVSNMNLKDLTKYVLVSQLKSVKGSDASWLHNNEPPENVKEYSDDEEERRALQETKRKRKYSEINNNLHPNNQFSYQNKTNNSRRNNFRKSNKNNSSQSNN